MAGGAGARPALVPPLAQLAIGNGNWLDFGYVPDPNREHLVEFERGYLPDEVQALWDMGQTAQTCITMPFKDAETYARPWMFAEEAKEAFAAFEDTQDVYRPDFVIPQTPGQRVVGAQRSASLRPAAQLAARTLR
jgi:hypothetical protein